MRVFFFFNDTATTEIYTLSLHDALPIFAAGAEGTASASASPGSGAWWTRSASTRRVWSALGGRASAARRSEPPERSEEHTSELQSRLHLVCRLLLEKKKKTICRGRSTT